MMKSIHICACLKVDYTCQIRRYEDICACLKIISGDRFQLFPCNGCVILGRSEQDVEMMRGWVICVHHRCVIWPLRGVELPQHQAVSATCTGMGTPGVTQCPLPGHNVSMKLCTAELRAGPTSQLQHSMQITKRLVTATMK